MKPNRIEAFLKKVKILPKDQRKPFWKALVKNLRVILPLSVLTLALEQRACFKHFETSALDSWLVSAKTREASNVMIVGIFDDDYKELFGESSPLKPSMVQEILNGIALGNPKVVGVDLDTSSEAFSGLSSPNAIWAQDAETECEQQGEELDTKEPCEEIGVVKPGNVLGGGFLRVGDLKDPASLAGKLRDARDPLSQFLQKQFSPDTQRLLESYDGPSPRSESLQTALVDELNRLLKEPSLYDEQRFGQVGLREETRELVHQNRPGKDVVRLNRLLVEEAYPQEIAKSQTPPTGIVLFPREEGVVRRYRRFFMTKDGTTSELRRIDSLPWAVVKDYCGKLKKQSQPAGCEEVLRVSEQASKAGNENHEELVLNFAGDRYRFKRISARDIRTGSTKDYWKDNSPIKDKIVLLGGFYRAARDEYVTPVGRMSGVELIAQAVESDLDGGGIKNVNHVSAIALDVLAACILVFLQWRFPSGRGVVFSLFATVVMVFLSSYLAFRALAYWFNFVPVLFGVFMHLQYESAKERHEMHRELEDYHRTYGELQGQPVNKVETEESV